MEPNALRWITVAILSLLLSYFLIRIFNPKSTFNSAIRNTGENSRYSLAKSQLLWWTVIITVCFAISFAEKGVIENVLNTSCLTLLGISLGTTTAGKVIDNTEEANPQILRHQVCEPKTSFWMDILSDHDGVSLHRFQSLIFNVLFGIVFIVQFFEVNLEKGNLPEFDSTTLGLIGLSSGGFVALKFNENTTKQNSQVAQQPPQPAKQE
ncbi:MAG: hypothetical protein AB8H03_06525 [Saprospiraceae bacterium]